MVNRDSKESVMDSALSEAIEDAVEQSYAGSYPDVYLFEQVLNEWGFMVVPIEDPTNMFGVMEDSL